MFVAMRIWLTILVCWPAPGPPWRIHFAPISFQSGSSAATTSGVAADHDRERAVLRADVAAGDRRIDARDAAFGPRPRRSRPPAPAGWSSCPPARSRTSRRRVHRRRPATLAAHHPDKPTIENTTSEAAATSRGESAQRAPRSIRSARFRLGAIVDRHPIAGVEHVAAHRAAHHAGADPADACLSVVRFRTFMVVPPTYGTFRSAVERRGEHAADKLAHQRLLRRAGAGNIQPLHLMLVRNASRSSAGSVPRPRRRPRRTRCNDGLPSRRARASVSAVPPVTSVQY